MISGLCRKRNKKSFKLAEEKNVQLVDQGYQSQFKLKLTLIVL